MDLKQTIAGLENHLVVYAEVVIDIEPGPVGAPLVSAHAIEEDPVLRSIIHEFYTVKLLRTFEFVAYLH